MERDAINSASRTFEVFEVGGIYYFTTSRGYLLYFLAHLLQEENEALRPLSAKLCFVQLGVQTACCN